MLKVNKGKERGEQRQLELWGLGTQSWEVLGRSLGRGSGHATEGTLVFAAGAEALQILALKQTEPTPGEPFERVNPWRAWPAFGTLMNRFSLEKESS